MEEERKLADIMRILICGDRNYTNYQFIYEYLAGCSLCKADTVIHGDCRGADRLGGIAGEALGAKIEACPAQWAKYGKSAGPIRNAKMLSDGNPDIVLAFHEDIEKSRGTKHMMTIARKAGVPVYLNGEQYE